MLLMMREPVRDTHFMALICCEDIFGYMTVWYGLEGCFLSFKCSLTRKIEFRQLTFLIEDIFHKM